LGAVHGKFLESGDIGHWPANVGSQRGHVGFGVYYVLAKAGLQPKTVAMPKAA
jgi:hypothetical protein